MDYVIGCGGVGSRLVPEIVRFRKEITLIDGDLLEEKNLDRQLFDEDEVGNFKAKALGKKYKIRNYINKFFSPDMPLKLTNEDLFWCCVDNHAARRAVLEVCDIYGCKSIIGANEKIDAEAYYYDSSFKNSFNDPRIVYPNMLSDNSDDPLRPESCQGHAAIANPQLGIANYWAAGKMLHLYWFWYVLSQDESFDIKKEYWPIHHNVNCIKYSTTRIGDRKDERAK